MIQGIVTGSLYGKPERRISKNGNSFVTAKLRVAMEAADSVFVGIVAFGSEVSEVLIGMSEGDAVAVSGNITVTVWEGPKGPRPNVSINAAQVLTAYQAKKKREGVAAAVEAAKGPKLLQPRPQPMESEVEEIPF